MIHSKMSEGENRITRWSYEDGVSPPNLPPISSPKGYASHLFPGVRKFFSQIVTIFGFRDNELTIELTNATFDQKIAIC